MIAKLFVNNNFQKVTDEINLFINQLGFSQNHPDVLFLETEKLNLDQAKQIKEFFIFKPHQAKGRVVVVNFVKSTTIEAQNALLKTIEELPEHAWLIIGTAQETTFLPTILSRCQIVKFQTITADLDEKTFQEIKEFTQLTIQDRFFYIEKVKEKDEFLFNLIKFFQGQLKVSPNVNEIKIFLDQCLEAEKWSKANINIRGILEHLSLNIPKN